MSALPPSEFSRIIDLRQIPPASVTLVASEDERRALAARFSLVRVDHLEAVLALVVDGKVVTASGRFHASWVQPCAISGEDLPQSANEPLVLRFVPPGTDPAPAEEFEITESDCDEIEYSGSTFDLGEAVAQSLGLAVDPFAEGPHAETARKAAGIVSEEATGPFSALAGLKLGKDDQGA